MRAQLGAQLLTDRGERSGAAHYAKMATPYVTDESGKTDACGGPSFSCNYDIYMNHNCTFNSQFGVRFIGVCPASATVADF